MDRTQQVKKIRNKKEILLKKDVNRKLKQRWGWGGGGGYYSVSRAPVTFSDYEKGVLNFVGQQINQYQLNEQRNISSNHVLYIMYLTIKKGEKYHTVRTIPKSIIKFVEIGNIDTS
jgi:rhamnogalacturonyl hydrolase YesR